MSQLQNEKGKNGQATRAKRREQNPTGLYTVLALNCVTVDEKQKPFFFLFSDIDDKTDYHLSRILKFFAFNELSFYWYGTSKGYHVISPCLLDIETWYKLRRGLKLIEDGYYEGLNIRFSPKNKNDFTKGFYDNGYTNQKYVESKDLNDIMVKRCKIKRNCKVIDQVPTYLQFTVYKEIEIHGTQY